MSLRQGSKPGSRPKFIARAWKCVRSWGAAIITGAAIGGSLFLLPQLQSLIASFLAEETQLDAFRSGVLTLGGALLGTTGISFGFVMFTLQVNLERLPHQAVRRFSLDRRLITYFLASFFLGSVVSFLPVFVSVNAAASAVLLAFWSTVLGVGFLFSGFQRALRLINPFFQVETFTTRGMKSLQRWARRARRHSSQKGAHRPKTDQLGLELPDEGMVRFLESHPEWPNVAIEHEGYLLALADRYARKDELTIVESALGGNLPGV
ncbi:MAG: hypothetical protein AAFY60_14815 [Myxococcota bacterium]